MTIAGCLDIQDRLAQRVAPQLAPSEADLFKKQRKAWVVLGLPATLYDSYSEFASFLFQSKLIVPLVGYQRAQGQEPSDAFQILGGEAHILIQGEWRSWGWIQGHLIYDESERLLLSRDNAEEIWVLLSPALGGLVRVARGSDQIFPIHQLTPREYIDLAMHANSANRNHLPPDCMVQIVSSPNPQLPPHALTENFNAWMPTHFWVRVITQDRCVYSFGLKIEAEEVLEHLYAPDGSIFDVVQNYLATFNGQLAMPDYKEFQKYPDGRYVTTLPATEDQARTILQMAAETFGRGIRMNYMHQNCSILPREVLRVLGLDVDTRTTGLNIVWQSLPGIEQIPYLGTAWKAVKIAVAAFCMEIWNATPESVKHVYVIIYDVVAYIPGKIATFLTNLIVFGILGGAKGTPVPNHLKNQPDQLENGQKPAVFSSLWQDWTSLFDDQVASVDHSKYLTDWQKAHPATLIYQDAEQGRVPMLCILPQEASVV
jgi:hypothetical protein